MNLSSRLLLLLALAGVALSRDGIAAAERVEITILGTTDLHGRILPLDYYTNRPAELGLAKLATLIRSVREEREHVLLLDCGDTIQGSPLAYYHGRINNEPPDPMMVVMNALGYDALAVGNHEYNFGLGVFQKARREANFPWLSANTYRAATNETALPPYIVKEFAGVRVGVLGFTTPGIPNWEDPAKFAGFVFREGVAAAREWVPVLRKRERADVVVLAMHMGFERNLLTGELWPGQTPDENAALGIAEEVPGIDVILMGHTHRDVPMHVVGDVLFCQAGRWGERLARIDLTVERKDDRWTVAQKTSRTLPVTPDVPSDPEILALAEPYHQATQAWLDEEIGECAVTLDARESRLRDTALMDLIHRVQLKAADAEVSMAASFLLSAQIPAGKVTIRDIAGIYVYENTLLAIELTGAQIKDALEHSAKFFREYRPGASAEDLIDTRVPGYNFDIAEGIDYTIDLRRPIGDRIVGLSFRGEPVDPARKFRVAINNYRQNGGGGYWMYPGAPVLQRSGTEVRNLIIQWVQQHRTIPTEPNHNWRIVTE